MPNTRARHVLPFLIVLVLVLSPFSADGRAGGRLCVVVHDVGHGDMIEITAPGGAASLLDCGSASSPGARQAVQALPRQLRFFIASHPHEDHIGNASSVVGRAETVIDGGFEDAGYAQAELYSWAARGKQFLIAEQGMRIELGDGVRMEVLAPAKEFIRGTKSDPNNNALVLMLTYGRFRMLFTGDIENEAIEELLARGPDLDCDVVKLPHHGSRGALKLAAALRPKYALVSAAPDGAREGHGLPHEDVLRAYRERGAEVYVTGRHGTLRVESDGEEYTITAARAN